MSLLFPMFGGKRNSSPKARLLIYCALLAMILLLFMRLHDYRYGKSLAPAAALQDYRMADSESDVQDPLAAIKPLPRFLGQIAEADLQGDAEGAERANQLATNSEAIRLSFSYLKGLAPEERQRLLSANEHFTWSQLMQYPDKWRGRPIHFYGIVLKIEKEPIPELPKGLQTLWRLTCFDARQNHFYTILTPRMSSGIRKNSRIAVDGLFLKRYPYWSQPNKKEKGFWQWTPLLVAPRAYLHWEPTPRGELLSQPEEQGFQLQKTVDELNPEFLEEQIFDVSKSGKGFRSLGSVRIAHEELARDLKGEKLGFEQLFQYVHDQGLQKLQTQTDERLHFGSLMVGDRAPRWARWQPCAVEGYVRFVERVHVSGLESGIEKFYLVTVTDGFLGDFDYNWTIAVLNLPYPMRAGDYVRTAGIFTKLYPYKSRMNDYRWTPLIVAPELKPAPREVARTPLWVYALGTVVILSVCAAIYFGVKREDARRKQLRDHLKEKRAARDAIRAVKRQQALNAAQESSDSSSDPLCDKRATEDDKEEN